MTTRAEALETITDLIREHRLTREDLVALYNTKTLPHEIKDQEAGSFLQRVLIYIGGAFVFMGLCVYIGMIWDDLGSLARVVISLGSGFVAFLIGLFAMGDPKFTRAATPLFLIAAALEPTGLFVFMDEYLPKSGEVAKAATFVFSFMTIQMSVAFALSQRTSLLFFTTFFFYASLYSIMSWFDFDAPEGPMVLGLSGLITAWSISRTPHGVIAPFFYFISASLVAAAAFDMFGNSHWDSLLIGVAAALIYLSTLAASRTLLTVGVIALLAYLGYYTEEYFADMVSWPVALIVMGLVMMGISVFAVKLGKKIAKQEA